MQKLIYIYISKCDNVIEKKYTGHDESFFVCTKVVNKYEKNILSFFWGKFFIRFPKK
jgi:hypothetical protein